MRSDSTKVKELSGYSVYQWQEDQFIENASTVIHSAKFSVHEITTSDGSMVYLVPEEFYQEAKSMFMRIVRKEEKLEESKNKQEEPRDDHK